MVQSSARSLNDRSQDPFQWVFVEDVVCQHAQHLDTARREPSVAALIARRIIAQPCALPSTSIASRAEGR